MTAGLPSASRAVARQVPQMAFQRALLVLALAAFVSHCTGCTSAGFDVTKVSVAAKPSDSNAYSLTDVKEHFTHMQPITYVSNTKQTYTCVDARGDDEHLSTPG